MENINIFKEKGVIITIILILIPYYMITNFNL